MFANSACSSTKIGLLRVSIADPDGIQKSEHSFALPLTGHCGISAWPRLTFGSWKLPDVAPESVTREKATAKRISSLTIGIVLKFFLKGLSPIFGLKGYPVGVFKVNLEHDSDICRILEHPLRTRAYCLGASNGSVK